MVKFLPPIGIFSPPLQCIGSILPPSGQSVPPGFNRGVYMVYNCLKNTLAVMKKSGRSGGRPPQKDLHSLSNRGTLGKRGGGLGGSHAQQDLHSASKGGILGKKARILGGRTSPSWICAARQKGGVLRKQGVEAPPSRICTAHPKNAF